MCWTETFQRGGESCSNLSVLIVLQRLDTAWWICLFPAWPLTPGDERGASLSKSAQRRDLRVSRSVLVEPAEITFVCAAVLCLFALRQKKKQKVEIETNGKTRGQKGGQCNSVLVGGGGGGCWALLSPTISETWTLSTTPASWDLPQTGGLCRLTTNYTWETEANKPNSEVLTPRNCCCFPHNKHIPPAEHI